VKIQQIDEVNFICLLGASLHAIYKKMIKFPTERV
jgi:hypothetical protein